MPLRDHWTLIVEAWKSAVILYKIPAAGLKKLLRSISLPQA
jgi:hypothetical protein